MARLFDDASSQALVVSSTGVTVPPFTLACWFYCNDATLQQALIGLPNTGFSARYHLLGVDGTVGGDPVIAITANGGTSGTASSSTGFSANTWHHACGVWSGTANRAAFIDGGSKGTNATSVTPASTPNSTGIGFHNGSTPDRYFSGRIAEAAVWSAALADAEVAALASGVCPLYIRSSVLVDYWPIWGLHDPEIDLLSANRTLTLNNAPTLADHAPVAPFSGRWWATRSEEVAAAVAGPLIGGRLAGVRGGLLIDGRLIA